MSTTTTTNLGLVKPTPGTGEYADVTVINGNMDKIDAAIGDVGNTSLQTQVTVLDGIVSKFSFDKCSSVTFMSTTSRDSFVIKGILDNGTTVFLFISKSSLRVDWVENGVTTSKQVSLT